MTKPIRLNNNSEQPEQRRRPTLTPPPSSTRRDLFHGPTGLGTSAAQLRAQIPGGKPESQTEQPGLRGHEPKFNQMDIVPFTALVERNLPALQIITPGQSRLLYPSHWQSPYAQGNRYASLFERATIAWLTRFGLIVTPEDAQTIQEFECGLYGGLSSPVSNFRDGLLLTQFVSLWLYFDDRVAEESTGWSLDDPVASLDAPTLGNSSNGFLNAWRDLCTRLRQTQSEAWMMRLGTALRAWIENAKVETQNAQHYQRTGGLPSFATMLEIRTVSIGMYPTFYLLEMAEGFELPECIHAHATIIELKRLASRLVGYGNDIGGLAKDQAHHWPNLVFALQQEHSISLEAAFENVVRLHNAEVEAFDRLACQLPAWGSDLDLQVKEWLQAVRYSVLGFTLWESLAARYQKWKLLPGGSALSAPVTIFMPAGITRGSG